MKRHHGTSTESAVVTLWALVVLAAVALGAALAIVGGRAAG